MVLGLGLQLCDSRGQKDRETVTVILTAVVGEHCVYGDTDGAVDSDGRLRKSFLDEAITFMRSEG